MHSPASGLQVCVSRLCNAKVVPYVALLVNTCGNYTCNLHLRIRMRPTYCTDYIIHVPAVFDCILNCPLPPCAGCDQECLYCIYMEQRLGHNGHNFCISVYGAGPPFGTLKTFDCFCVILHECGSAWHGWG